MQRNFARHCNVMPHWNPRQSGNNRCYHRNTSRRTILRHCSFRSVNVKVVLQIEVLRNVILLGNASYIANGNLSTFFHDIAQRASQFNHALSVQYQCFQWHQHTADRCPRQTIDNPNGILFALVIRQIFFMSQISCQVLGGNRHPFPAKSCQHPFQFPHACFSGVIVNQRIQNSILYLELCAL